MAERESERRQASSADGRRRYSGLPEEAVEGIAALFQSAVTREPYSPGGNAPVYAIGHRSETGTLRLLCWPSLCRVDVTCGPHAWVVKSIVETEVIPGVEVVFRMAAGGMLFVGVHGDVLMVSGAPVDEAGAEG